MTNKMKIALLAIISIILITSFLVIGLNARNWRYFLSTRIPKLIAIIITGGGIALSSMVFQTITNNRILTPSVLGLDSLYLLIQTLVIFVFGSSSRMLVNKNLNFLFTVGLMIAFSSLLYKLLFKKENRDIMTLLLVGLILGTLFQSISTFMQMVIDPNEFLHIQDKMFASFNNINTGILSLSSFIVFIVGALIFKKAKTLDVLALGRESAISLGIDYEKTVFQLLLIVSILVSISTALVGPITFLGLLIVNLSREFLKTFEHSYLILGAMLMGLVALIGGQLLVERVFNFASPISVIINFIGGIYFIFLLLKENAE